MLSFITGGTSALPRFVNYTRERWLRVVEVKARMLAFAGVRASSRVLVMHPMAPWSIGQVFCEGAAALDAHVFPVGLSLRPTTLAHLLRDFEPTVVCGGGRNLLRVLDSVDLEARERLASSVEVVLTAGEPLEDPVRSRLKQLLDCSLYDIYGCAEMDALAIEGASEGVLNLVPEYQYRLAHEDTGLGLTVGSRGELEVCDPRQGEGASWHNTKDQVLVVSPGIGPSPWGTPSIRIEGRTDLTVTFGDGCAVGQEQLRELASTVGLKRLQLQVARAPEGDTILLMCSAEAPLPSTSAIEGRFLDLCTDFADALGAGCIQAFEVQLAASAADYWDTERGKTPIIVIRNSAV